MAVTGSPAPARQSPDRRYPHGSHHVADGFPTSADPAVEARVDSPPAPSGAQMRSVYAGFRRITYVATAPAANRAATETAVASQVAPSHWAPK